MRWRVHGRGGTHRLSGKSYSHDCGCIDILIFRNDLLVVQTTMMALQLPDEMFWFNRSPYLKELGANVVDG